MDMPPSRYRVVERDRRLVVIDTRTGAPVTGTERQPRSARGRGKVQAPRPSTKKSPPIPAVGSSTPIPGEKVLTTQAWFDNKAPRRVYIDDSRNSPALVIVGIALVVLFFVIVSYGWPAMVVAAALVSGGRKQIRAGVTRWLDGFDQV